ncbi:hypothetical protein QR680_008964 [Steinernema hermaphroditum]|uniref:Innexin n=1 Tax=Steinernema hermaphroditum TaxID=289476 RepID=A0AA39M922_9BILA|nr:hypothetical protein QR680_008964 [Steinernema hermaphroditum]
MDFVFGLIDNILKDRFEEDFIDRLNYQYTPIVMGACASVLFAKVYLGLSIQCFTKAQFKGTWNAYTHDYCLIENTYYIPQETNIPHTTQRSEAQLAYYQWTGFILAGLALFFILPHVLWRSFNWISGYHIRPIIKECYEAKDNAKEQGVAIERSARLLHEASKLDHSYFHILPRNTVVTFLYIFMKVLFIGVIFAELAVLSVFLGSFAYPFQVLRYDLGDWQSSGLFPRVTLCDIDIRVPGQYQKYTMECTLPLNMLNEKIFVFLFFYLLMLAIVTFLNICYWIALLARGNGFFHDMSDIQNDYPHAVCGTVSSDSSTDSRAPLLSPRHIEDEEDPKKRDLERCVSEGSTSALINDYVHAIEGTDLMIVLRLLKHHVGMFITSDIFVKMAQLHFDEEKEKKAKAQH